MMGQCHDYGGCGWSCKKEASAAIACWLLCDLSSMQCESGGSGLVAVSGVMLRFVQILLCAVWYLSVSKRFL